MNDTLADGPHPEDALALLKGNAQRNKYVRFLVSAMSGIPWVGPLLGAGASLNNEADQGKEMTLIQEWLKIHEEKLRELAEAVGRIAERMAKFDEGAAQSRLGDARYLGLVRRGFRVWDRAETAEKRAMVVAVLSNAGSTSLTSDDVVRLFLDWMDRYDEMHFAVIREVYKQVSPTRLTIWEAIRGDLPRENSADADLYRLLVDELSQGRIIRQARDVDSQGRFLKRAGGRKVSRSPTMLTAFDDEKDYELSELGKQFVHYAMSEIIPRVGSGTPA